VSVTATPSAPRRWTSLTRVVPAAASDGALVAGVVLLGLLAVAVAAAPLLTAAHPTRVDLLGVLLHPGQRGHPLGTDQLGRDILARVLYGGRTDLLLGFGSVIPPFLIGGLLGAVAGYRGGVVEAVVTGAVQLVFAFPFLVLILALVFALGAGVWTIVVAVAITDWVAYAQVVRSGVRSQRELEYVQAARSGGLGGARILFRHILPNVIGQAVVYATSDVILLILGIVALGYLGVGVPPPAPDWGSMIADGQHYLSTNPAMVVAPEVGILLAALALALLGDGLAHRLDVG
jgi:peptide/nickel transport system permease protein